MPGFRAALPRAGMDNNFASSANDLAAALGTLWMGTRDRTAFAKEFTMPAILQDLTGHAAAARELVADLHAHDGLIPMDVDRFWRDDAQAHLDPFGAGIPQVALGIRMGGECVFDELGLPEDHYRLHHDQAWANEVARAYNAKAERIVGKSLVPIRTTRPEDRYPAVKGLHDVFEARNEWHGQSYWLRQVAKNEAELEALLDRVMARDIRSFILPTNWAEEKARLLALGMKPPLYRGQRGPVTFATSIYGAEELIFLCLDNPDLAARLRDAILHVMLGIARVLDEEAGYAAGQAPRGFSFLDDNCCLLNPKLYEFFGYPILKGIFERYAPNPGDRRYQHSDSPMAHLLPYFGPMGLNLSGVNFGPTLSVSEIRAHCPRAVIQGQLAPFTFSRNREEAIVLECLRDIEQARASRGLVLTTAGSINNGSRLTGMRLIMATIQRFGRYDR
ncbi:MAG: hypothetical protein M5U26_12730 [Planctomycetota bacterium]|nr:hypothetical protein [Planctomycetota bacterium]